MINWGKIDSNIFEKLAYEMISDIYPSIKWTPTKETHDGNKDGESVYNAPINITIKYWYEAKYSKDINSCIPKSHLDSTLVSCVLDGKVVSIAFITNAYISEDYQRRANIFSKQRDNLRIIYINGDEVENWLFKHPEIEFKYFESNSAKQKTLENRVENYCILQKYDDQGSHFNKANDLIVSKEYVLYLSFYSSCNQILSVVSTNNAIEFISKENRKYDQFNYLEANKGLNTFFIPINVVCNSNELLSFIITSNNEEYQFFIKNIHILDIYNPHIIHRSQIEIQQNLFTIINSNDNFNSIIFILASAGCGKSYLLDSVYSNSLNPFSSHVFNFTGNNTTDTLLCYKVIITSLYGEIWDCLDDYAIYNNFSEIEKLMIQQIKNAQVITSGIDQTITFYKNDYSRFDAKVSQSQILLDDYHKLSKANQDLMNSFFSWFINQRMNCKIFVFSRPEIRLPKTTTRYFTISNIEYNDIEATLKTNFNSLYRLPKLIRKYPIPLNILQFSNILSLIHNKEYELKNKNEFETELILNQIYSNSIHMTNLTLGSGFLAEYKNNELVYIIYKISTGISHTALSSFFDRNIYTELYTLCEKKIIKESSNTILPFHDIYIAAFSSYKSDQYDKTLEKFVLFAQSNGYITKAKMFAVLIDIGKECLWKYRKDASEYRDTLHNNADYNGALEIAKMLRNINKKNLSDYSLEDCQNQFVLANCIKYTSSYDEANKEFEKIKTVYYSTRNRDILSLYLESQTEIINNHIWMLNINQAITIIGEIESLFDELYEKKQIIGRHMTYAFLNFYNRIMFINFMIDKGSETDYENAIKYSTEMKHSEYIAFAKMDYAKCLYNQDLDTSKELLVEAQKFFLTSSEKRRELDAESELCFLNDLQNKTISYNHYSIIKNKMLKHNYIQSYIKIQLKLIILRLLFSKEDTKTIRADLDCIAVNNSSISSGKRHQAFINHLYAATYYKENSFNESRKYSIKCLELMRELGKSYTEVHKNNKQLIEFNGFSIINKDNKKKKQIKSFVIDIRVW